LLALLSYRLKGLAVSAILVLLCLAALSSAAIAQNKYENRRLAEVKVTDASGGQTLPSPEEFQNIVNDTLGSVYSTTRIRDSLAALYATKRIATINVVATEAGEAVNLRFEIKPKALVERVTIQLTEGDGDRITEQELLFKLNILAAGTPITEAALRSNADTILEYLRDRGYYKSEVTYTQSQVGTGTDTAVVFNVKANAQARVENFKISIDGLKEPIDVNKLELKPGEGFSRERLNKDVEKVRDILQESDFVAPTLDEPRVLYDSEKNVVNVELSGRVGPTVRISVEPKEAELGSGTLNRLLPVKTEGTLDYSAIVQGERRLENHFQENGYFFAQVTPVCSVDPPLTDVQNQPIPNESEFVCSTLTSNDLTNRVVDLKYRVDLNRKLRLTSIRIRGTDEFTIDDVRATLKSQEANALGYIPVFGYGRGYTSENILEEDAATLRSIMVELGYRDAQVRANQGVSATGDSLIITFEIEEGPRTYVNGVTISGNTAVDTATLLAQIPGIDGTNFSRAKFRNAVRKLSAYYSEAGYYNARVAYSVVDIPSATADPMRKEVRLEFRVTNEGKKVRINRVLTTGYENTKPEAILRFSALEPGELLKSSNVYQTEQNLYSTDAFDRVDVKVQPVGNGASDGERLTDIVIGVNEQPARLLTYGGGYSTDIGANGFIDIRHVNLFGNLWQGGARLRASPRQQLIQIDFVNPRFMRDGAKRYSPLTLTAQYQRDSTVTRFFRSAFDKGTFGIVQRVDADGNPIDDFGNETSSPTINRLTFTAETSRTIDRKTRSILFGRYRFEDVRIFNVDSLLIKDLIRPDSRIRISGVGLTFARDTRENCSVTTSFLELLARGEPNALCKYSASDPTRGSYLVAEYNVSAPWLGANIGFQKFQATYNFYYTLPGIRNTTIAARGILGLATVFSAKNRFPAPFSDLNDALPISERFFAGGANTLRGFDFEEAGPRLAIMPQGIFRNSRGEPVFLDPFTVPFGGNALAIVNLEARVPLTNSIRAVPFYDGGNVFRRVRDIFKAPTVAPNDVVGQNLRAVWTHTVGLGFRLKTPIGGEFGVDYGYLLNPPRFLVPQAVGPNAVYQLPRSQIHFRFSQAF
jgi:outer membrane protein insertion porin family